MAVATLERWRNLRPWKTGSMKSPELKNGLSETTPMPTMLTETEVRVLGSLIEKQITTPEYYPLTLNSLTAACNQKNNRNPVTTLTESEVDEALDTLREKNLAYVFHGSTSRVPKYK